MPGVIRGILELRRTTEYPSAVWFYCAYVFPSLMFQDLGKSTYFPTQISVLRNVANILFRSNHLSSHKMNAL